VSVHPDPDRRGFWLVRWREDGRHRSRRGFSSPEAAQEFNALKRREARLGAHGVAEPAAVRLEVWLADWWERYAVGWRRSTQQQRSPILKKWVVPYLGRVRLRDLGEARVRSWRAQIIRDGCTANRANATMLVLSSALSAAVQERLIPTNPLIGELRIRKLPHRVERPRVLTPLEIEAIRLAMASGRDRLIVSIGAYAGLRPEETVALRWTSVSGQALTIDEAYTAGELGQTKTGGRRVVPIVEPLAAELAAWRLVYESEVGTASTPTGLVVPARRGGHVQWDAWRERVWGPAREAARLDGDGTRVAYCRPYDLRHSYASLAIHEGRPVNQVAGWMGHGQATTTLRHYAHLFDEAQMSASLPMVDAITAARLSLYKSYRSRFVPGPGEPARVWDAWLSLMWPGFSPDPHGASPGRMGEASEAPSHTQPPPRSAHV